MRTYAKQTPYSTTGITKTRCWPSFSSLIGAFSVILTLLRMLSMWFDRPSGRLCVALYSVELVSSRPAGRLFAVLNDVGLCRLVHSFFRSGSSRSSGLCVGLKIVHSGYSLLCSYWLCTYILKCHNWTAYTCMPAGYKPWPYIASIHDVYFTHLRKSPFDQGLAG